MFNLRVVAIKLRLEEFVVLEAPETPGKLGPKAAKLFLFDELLKNSNIYLNARFL